MKHFFDFLLNLVKVNLIKKIDFFMIFEEVFECAPESTLEDLFEYFEHPIL